MGNSLNGLSSKQARELQSQYGKNEISSDKKENLFKKILNIIKEPMFLLLISAATIYFILGEPTDGAIMLIFVICIIGIETFQEWKTDKTLKSLKDLSAPRVTVLRDGTETEIASADLVPGDIMAVHEGVKIPADGFVISCNDLCIDESSLTGEPDVVWKTAKERNPSPDYWRKDYCYAGTFVAGGNAVIKVDKIGKHTEYGKIGEHIAAAPDRPTPLEKQTRSLVKLCAVIAVALFVLVCVITWFNLSGVGFKDRLTDSVLSGIALAMAMIPEEFPVILAVFLSMGAWRLAKKNSLVRRLSAVETLGAVSVLCVDKTGTITMNQMAVQQTWTYDCDETELCETMGLGCETETYDPMEKAMLDYCDGLKIDKEHLFSGELIREYPFTNELKMMGHVWLHDGEIIIAAKGSPERILSICELPAQKAAESKILEMSQKGLRVIAVAEKKLADRAAIPEKITDCKLNLLGLIGLEDPLRDSVKKDIAECYKAGVRVVMITGDNGVTAASIAVKAGIKNTENMIGGDTLDKMSDSELHEAVKNVSIFSRVVPEHKMRIVKAFRDNGETTAMTGDGVNDAPALKHADIGIAMGKRGSEVSREAADIILMDDNFSTIVDTVKDGRRIFDNIIKAIGYVFAIHVPIALSSLLAPMLKISPEHLFIFPLHVVLLELIVDPTCSVVLERQPPERGIMNRPPRDTDKKMLSLASVVKGLTQGLAIFAASFGVYFYQLTQTPNDSATARAMGIAVIMLANLFLVLVNSSDSDFMFVTLKSLIKDKVMWAVAVITVIGLGVILYTPLNSLFKLAPLNAAQAVAVLITAAASVLWFELVKAVKRKQR